ncbi:uncharacterized protein V1518DRAFT_422177 [Limtongia smithiae]|uniref:uncharacterized protein n=1 Tax=Limtongia smithiae TaxID=1125753 RepID=UPI0034CEB6DF
MPRAPRLCHFLLSILQYLTMSAKTLHVATDNYYSCHQLQDFNAGLRSRSQRISLEELLGLIHIISHAERDEPRISAYSR